MKVAMYQGDCLEVERDGLGCDTWVARYGRWEVARECPLLAVADVLAFELESILREAVSP